jgi:aminoglycoside 6'-N-acetyltransferase
MADAAGPVRLTEGDLCVRTPLESDLPAMRALFGDPTVERWWGHHDDRRVAGRLDRDDVIGLAVVRDGRLVGWVQVSEELHPVYRHAGVDIALASDAQGSGTGPRTLRLVVDWLTSERGHHRVTIDPAVSNERAIAAYRKVGFRDVGVMHSYERSPDGTFHDALLMEYVVSAGP